MTIIDIHNQVVEFHKYEEEIFNFDLHKYFEHIERTGFDTKLKDLIVYNHKFDSLDWISYGLALEKIFNISIPDREIYKWKTIRDAYNTVLAIIK